MTVLREFSPVLRADREADISVVDNETDVALVEPEHLRQAFVEEGLEAALYRKKPSDRQYRKLD